MSYKLTEKCLEPIMSGVEITDPVLQILNLKKINSGSARKERYRMMISDGVYTVSHAMLASENNDRVVESGDFTIIKAKRFVSSQFNNENAEKSQRILLMLNVEIIATGKEVGRKIGNPIPLSEARALSGSSNSNNLKKNEDTKKASKPSNAMEFDSNSPSLEGQMIHPISSLTPYQNRWIIKARVMNKSAIRTWSNSKGEGKLFSMDLCDESGEIRCTAFRDMVDKFYDYVQVDKIYYISKCQLKPANKQYSSLKNDYEMTVFQETIIQECQNDDNNIPTTKYDFVTIDKIANLEVGTLVDVCGISKEASDLQTFQAKSTGRELKKREIVLLDQSNTSINLTLWGSDAENFNGTNNPVVVIKGAKVGEFGGGKNISCLASSLLKLNPDIPESFRIRGWYDQDGNKGNIIDLSAKTGSGSFSTSWMSLKEVKDQNLGNGEKGDYFQTLATILLMRSENLTYKACPTEKCNKKVVDLENGMYRCEKCNREFPNFKFRLLSSMNISDWSGNAWVSMFSSEAETILGMTAEEVGQQIEQDLDAANQIVERAHFKEFIFKCRAKIENYNDESRLKTVVIEVKPVVYKEVNTQIINRIKSLMG